MTFILTVLLTDSLKNVELEKYYLFCFTISLCNEYILIMLYYIYFSDLFAELKPELIAPVVVWLCHEQCTDNGTIVEAAAGWATKC